MLQKLDFAIAPVAIVKFKYLFEIVFQILMSVCQLILFQITLFMIIFQPNQYFIRCWLIGSGYFLLQPVLNEFSLYPTTFQRKWATSAFVNVLMCSFFINDFRTILKQTFFCNCRWTILIYSLHPFSANCAMTFLSELSYQTMLFFSFNCFDSRKKKRK